MDYIELSLEEAQEHFNRSRATIYNWTNAGKLKYRDDGDKRIVLLTREEYEKPAVKSNIQSNNLNSPESKLDNNSIVTRILDQNDKLIDQISTLTIEVRELSKEAGQVKLLTDNNQFYTNEYFSLKIEKENLEKELDSKNQNILNLESKIKDLELLQDRNKELEKEISDLKQQLEKKSSFFGIFKK